MEEVKESSSNASASPPPDPPPRAASSVARWSSLLASSCDIQFKNAKSGNSSEFSSSFRRDMMTTPNGFNTSSLLWRTSQEKEETLEIMREMHEKKRKDKPEDLFSFLKVPRFRFERSLQSHFITRIARDRVLDRYNRNLVSSDRLDLMFSLLKQDADVVPINPTVYSGGLEGSELRISYDRYCKVREVGGFEELMTHELFLEFEHDEYGRINVYHLIAFFCRKCFLEELHVQLSIYDTNGDGYLTDRDFENIFYDLLEKIPQLQELEELHHFVYVFTAVRKIFFFLDSMRMGKITISSFLNSPMVFELFELRNPVASQVTLANNWFSAQSFRRVYGIYLRLDKDRSGLLSQEEFMSYSDLTPLFVERIFQERNTYSGEIDYRTYLEVVLATENKKHPKGMRYFFELFDIDKTGILTPHVVAHFFRDVIRQLNLSAYEPIQVDDVVGEIFDMVKPKVPHCITLEDLIACKCGDTVVNILTSVGAFKAFENL